MGLGSAPVDVLVTGGAGYIGSVLAGVLLEEGLNVTVLDSFLYGRESLSACEGRKGFRLVFGDCRDERLLKEALRGADFILPLAALVGAPLCEKRPKEARAVNLDAVQTLCRLATKTQGILFPTTNSGYGIGEKGKYCTEETPLRPVSLYGRTKAAAEQVVMDRGNAVSFRLATVFGVSPRMRTDLLVNDFVFRAVRGETVVLYEGHFRRNFLHVRDAAGVFLHGLKNHDRLRDQVYNVGLEDANLSKRELCELIKKTIPGFSFREDAAGRDPDRRDYIVSNAKILATGFRPAQTLEGGIRELAEACRALPEGRHANV